MKPLTPLLQVTLLWQCFYDSLIVVLVLMQKRMQPQSRLPPSSLSEEIAFIEEEGSYTVRHAAFVVPRINIIRTFVNWTQLLFQPEKV